VQRRLQTQNNGLEFSVRAALPGLLNIPHVMRNGILKFQNVTNTSRRTRIGIANTGIMTIRGDETPTVQEENIFLPER